MRATPSGEIKQNFSKKNFFHSTLIIPQFISSCPEGQTHLSFTEYEPNQMRHVKLFIMSCNLQLLIIYKMKRAAEKFVKNVKQELV